MPPKTKEAREAQELKQALNRIADGIATVGQIRTELQTVALALNALAEKMGADDIADRLKPVLLAFARDLTKNGVSMPVRKKG